MLVDIAKRKFITVGFTGFVLLIPLAITSTSGWIRRLGGRRWNRLHQLIYLAAIAGVIHYYWLVKADVRKPLQYAVVLSLLLGYRLVISMFRNSTQTKMPDSRDPACKSLAWCPPNLCDRRFPRPLLGSETKMLGTKSQVDPSEAELIQRALTGQEEALRELVRPCEHSWLLKLFEE